LAWAAKVVLMGAFSRRLADRRDRDRLRRARATRFPWHGVLALSESAA